VLGMKRPVLALIREVVLYGEGQPWVFARSVLPITSLCGKLRHLRKQNTRPLGAFLFSQPDLQRSSIVVAQISDDHAYVPARLTQGQNLWGRRSVFYLDAKPLLVSEVFLPGFCTRIGASLNPVHD
jgi:chorismate--pyruvate lyase